MRCGRLADLSYREGGAFDEQVFTDVDKKGGGIVEYSSAAECVLCVASVVSMAVPMASELAADGLAISAVTRVAGAAQLAAMLSLELAYGQAISQGISI
jgi:hypothetical protein